jgi:hypothetical protein
MSHLSLAVLFRRPQGVTPVAPAISPPHGLFSLPADPGPEADQDRKADRDWKADSAQALAPVCYRAASAASRHCPDSDAAADLGGQAVESPAAGAWGAAGADAAAELGAPAAAGGVAGAVAA